MRGARPGGATHPFGRTRAITPCRDPTAGAPTSDAACRSSRKRSLPFTAQVVHPEKSLCLLALRVAGIVGVSRRRGVFTTRRDRDACPAPDLVDLSHEHSRVIDY